MSPATKKSGREVPRPFEFQWGRGQVIEEASYVGQHTEPAIQLLEFGVAAHGPGRVSTP